VTAILVGLRDRFWVIPALCALLAVLLGLLLSTVASQGEDGDSSSLLFEGGPEGARVLLSAIITSMISFTALVFSITIVVLQLTSSQFSPRVLRTFLRDRFNQITLGVFIASFVYALVVLRSVRGTTNNDPYVPQLAITVAVVLVLASVALFLGYIHHISQAIRAATIVNKIGDETRALLEQTFPVDGHDVDGLPLPTDHPDDVATQSPGVIQRIDDSALAHWATEHDSTVCLRRAVGEFVPAGATMLTVYARGTEDAKHADLLDQVMLGRERSLDQDVGFGLRQLVDIAERALSPGINDPTTAIQVIDQIHDLLRRLSTRALPPRQQLSDSGRLLVDVPQPSFANFLSLGLDEVARWGKDSERVQRRLLVMLMDLRKVARPEHRAPVNEALDRHRQWTEHLQLDETAPSDVGLR
jgi:uncharacterized membrane protein